MKTRPSILDPFAAQLAEWDAAGRTLAEMQTNLAASGCKVSLARLSQFLSAQRSASLQAGLLQQISTGAAAVKEVERELARNPAPEIATLISLYRVLILKLSTMGNADPSLLELATGMTKTALDFEKLQLKRGELELTREKFELLKAQAERAESTERVLADAELTPAQREQRIKEIYGRA